MKGTRSKATRSSLVALIVSQGLLGCPDESVDVTPAVLSRSAPAPGSEPCTGQSATRVSIGLDQDRDGQLDDAEITSSLLLCGGAIAPLTRLVEVFEGEHCARGGTRFDVGYDDGEQGSVAGDGILSDGEVRSSRYVCTGADGAPGKDGNDGRDGQDAVATLVRVLAESAGANCTAAGQRVELGADVDADGLLSDGEVHSTQYVCNGDRGADTGLNQAIRSTPQAASSSCPSGGRLVELGLDDGSGSGSAGDGVLADAEVDHAFLVCDGATGARGAASLVRMFTEPSGANCRAGGTLVLAGSDSGQGGAVPGDGALTGAEIEYTGYICQGVSAISSLVVVRAEPAGSNCGAGGQRIQQGLDHGGGGGIASDGVLQSGEVATTSYVCHGTSGATSLVSVLPEPQGDNCTFGGQRIESGFDDGKPSGLASDHTLQPGEVDATSYACHGNDGMDGLDGFSSLVSTQTLESGVTCAAGGLRIDSGLDDGSAGGIARNGSLEPGEVTSVRHVCNGVTLPAVGNGARLTDSRGSSLGVVLTSTTRSITFITAAEYLATINWNGTFAATPLYYATFSGGVCGGTAYLSAGAGTVEQYMYGKTLTWSPALNSFVVPSAQSIQSDWTAKSVHTATAGITVQGLENPSCVSGTSNGQVWALRTISRSSAGIPATIVPPLNID